MLQAFMRWYDRLMLEYYKANILCRMAELQEDCLLGLYPEGIDGEEYISMQQELEEVNEQLSLYYVR